MFHLYLIQLYFVFCLLLCFLFCFLFVMARRAIPMIAFHGVESSVHLREYALKLRRSRGLGQLMGVARKRTRARALLTLTVL